MEKSSGAAQLKKKSCRPLLPDLFHVRVSILPATRVVFSRTAVFQLSLPAARLPAQRSLPASSSLLPRGDLPSAISRPAPLLCSLSGHGRRDETSFPARSFSPAPPAPRAPDRIWSSRAQLAMATELGPALNVGHLLLPPMARAPSLLHLPPRHAPLYRVPAQPTPWLPARAFSRAQLSSLSLSSPSRLHLPAELGSLAACSFPAPSSPRSIASSLSRVVRSACPRARFSFPSRRSELAVPFPCCGGWSLLLGSADARDLPAKFLHRWSPRHVRWSPCVLGHGRHRAVESRPPQLGTPYIAVIARIPYCAHELHCLVVIARAPLLDPSSFFSSLPCSAVHRHHPAVR
jgi:hypothetical protein